MKLTYKILWVDDRIEEPQYKEMIENLNQFLSEEEFFDVKIVNVDNSDDFEKELNADYDLIITDYNLGEKNGDHIIQYTRELSVLTEIFFYSANNELKPLGNLISNSRVTFHQMTDPNGYRELYGQIKSLIELTIRKFQDIICMRGMVMAETSEIDVAMEEMLNLLLKDETEEKNMAKKVIKDKYIESSKNSFNKISEINEVESLNLLLRKVGSEHRWRGLKRNFPQDYRNEFKQILEDYKKDIIDIRNILAHAKYFKEEGREYLENFDPEGEPHKFNTENCKQLRRNLNLYKKGLVDMQKKLNK